MPRGINKYMCSSHGNENDSFQGMKNKRWCCPKSPGYGCAIKVWCTNCNVWEDRTRYFSKHRETNHSKGEDLATATSTPTQTIANPAVTDITSRSHEKRKGGMPTNSTTSLSKDTDFPIDIMNTSSSESESEQEMEKSDSEINSDSSSIIDAELVTNILQYLRRKRKLKRSNRETEKHEHKKAKLNVKIDATKDINAATDIKQMLTQVCTLISENMKRESEIVSALGKVEAQLTAQSAYQDSTQSIASTQTTQQMFKSLDDSNDSFEPKNL